MGRKENHSHRFPISIIIPVYNAEDYLAARIEHLLSFNLDSTQIIIVNDGSTDSCHEICRHYLADCANTVLINQENQGLSVARNKGVEAADGEYIVFLDSDDVLLEHGFEVIRAYLSENKPDVLVGKYVLMQENGRNIWPDYTFPTVYSASEARMFIYSGVLDSIWNAWRYVCRRDFLLQHELFFAPGFISEDMEWSPRVLRIAKHISFANEPFYGYYYNKKGSITRTARYKRVLDVNKIVACSIPRYITEPYGEALAYRLTRESFYSINRYCLCRKDERKELRPVIENAISYYHNSSSYMVRLFMKTRRIIPLFAWSLFLLAAKSARGLLKGLLGPLSAKRRKLQRNSKPEKALSVR